MAKVRVVTGYVPIPNHPRTAEEYGRLGERFKEITAASVIPFYSKLEQCWLWRLAWETPNLTHSEGDNPAKNTLAYHAVNHQKTTWLMQASLYDDDADIFVWMDYGIFHLPGVNGPVIDEFIKRLDDKCIYIPGCWEGPVIQDFRMTDRLPDPDADPFIDDNNPCWRFCGTVLVCPRRYCIKLDEAVRRSLYSHVARTKNISWEVNTWARMEKTRTLPIKWYKADHNERLFTGFKPTLDA